MKFALGKKMGMTTIYNESGAQNVTLVEIVPCAVDLVRTEEKDGYQSIRLSTEKTKKKDLKKEFRTEGSDLEVGSQVAADIFEVGDVVMVSATAKAKGFQGVVKRHGFKGGPASHGHRHVLRRPGSIGSAFPQHVVKGKRMAGRMGGKRATIKSLTVVAVDVEKGYIAVKGSVPGVSGRYVEVTSA